jgi:hypothetical protein
MASALVIAMGQSDEAIPSSSARLRGRQDTIQMPAGVVINCTDLATQPDPKRQE